MKVSYMIDQLIEPSSINLLEKQQKQYNHKQASTFNLSNKQKISSGSISHSSYKAVLEQSLTTQDKPLIYEILAESTEQVIKNTLEQINVSKVSPLLKIIQYFLGEYKSRVDNTISIAKWLQWLLKIHLSIIVSNVQNKQIIERIRKLIQKRTSQREALLKIKQKLYGGQIQKSQVKVHNPKFDYVESQKIERGNQQGAQDENRIEEQGMDLQEGIQDFFQQEDF